jgi:hypothetical protein
VLILPPGHAQAIRTPRQVGRREKVVVAVMLATAIAVVVAVLVSFATSSSHKSANGCVDVTIAGDVGGTEIYRCGEPARELCQTALRPGVFAPASAQEVAGQCRKAGLPVG